MGRHSSLTFSRQQHKVQKYLSLMQTFRVEESVCTLSMEPSGPCTQAAMGELGRKASAATHKFKLTPASEGSHLPHLSTQCCPAAVALLWLRRAGCSSTWTFCRNFGDAVKNVARRVQGALPIVGLLSRLASSSGGIGRDELVRPLFQSCASPNLAVVLVET